MSGGSSDTEMTADIQTAAEVSQSSLLPEHSKDKYLVAYNKFMTWRKEQDVNSFSENVFLTYFSELAQTFKPSSLWCIYSILRGTIMSKHAINIKNYEKLTNFLKRLSKGFQPKKSKILIAEQIEQFFNEAPDKKYLATKVTLIFGISGACSSDELVNITTDDIGNYDTFYLVKLPKTSTKSPRSFIIEGEFYEKVKKYAALRPKEVPTNRFFLNYQDEKCTKQVIGKNKFSSTPKNIAKFLKLPDANDYTVHAFRRSAATLLASAGADSSIVRHHGGWKSYKSAVAYVEDSMKTRQEIGRQITESLNIRPTNSSLSDEPSTSKLRNQHDARNDGNDENGEPKSKKLRQDNFSIVTKCCINLVKKHGRSVTLFDDRAFKDLINLIPMTESERQIINAENIQKLVEDDNVLGDDTGIEVTIERMADAAADDDDDEDEIPLQRMKIKSEVVEASPCTYGKDADESMMRHTVECPGSIQQTYWNFFEVSLDNATCQICYKTLSWTNISSLKEHLQTTHPSVDFVDDDDKLRKGPISEDESTNNFGMEEVFLEENLSDSEDAAKRRRKKAKAHLNITGPISRENIAASLDRFKSLDCFGQYVASLMKLIPKDKCIKFQIMIIERLLQEQAAAG